ncbi:MAG: hypothetical protein ACKV19_22910 [Verrucomicrobiales bacterium]
MRCLTYSECAEWCARRDFPMRHIEGCVVGPHPELESPPFHFVDFTVPTDSGRKVAFGRFLYSLIDSAPELLFWLGEWAVWPSSQHMPLFSRFRQAHGESRPLIEAPGNLLGSDEADDAVSILVVSLQFVWNCHILSSSGRDAVFVSHDEFGWFASRDEAVAASARRKIEKNWRAHKDNLMPTLPESK